MISWSWPLFISDHEVLVLEHCLTDWDWLDLLKSYLQAKQIFSTCFGWDEFHGISTIVGYLMPNPVYHHHHIPSAQISLTISRHPSLSSITSGWSSRLRLVAIQSCCMYVRAGRPAFARPYEGVHKSTSLMSSPLLLQQCPACLVHQIFIVFMMGGSWLYSYCFMGCCF